MLRPSAQRHSQKSKKSKKMYPVNCTVCKNTFYTEEKLLGSSKGSQDVLSEGPNGEQKARPARTSTPVPEVKTGSSGFGNSVTDFFYQSCKSGLHSNETTPNNPQQKCSACLQCEGQPGMDVQPVYYPQYFVFINTVLYTTYAPFGQYSYAQPVGYRPDGTYGVLPTTPTMYWGYN